MQACPETVATVESEACSALQALAEVGGYALHSHVAGRSTGLDAVAGAVAGVNSSTRCVLVAGRRYTPATAAGVTHL
jgi:hypothetical protein